jgi:hypothetical protein
MLGTLSLSRIRCTSRASATAVAAWRREAATLTGVPVAIHVTTALPLGRMMTVTATVDATPQTAYGEALWAIS